jgi:hypothetical protein
MKHYNSEITSPVDNELINQGEEEIKISSEFSLVVLGNNNGL